MNTSPLISSSSIQNILTPLNVKTPFELHIFNEIDSTNRFLKEFSTENRDMIPCCIAEMQTKGRGRFGKEWFSPFGENIYCSCRFKFSTELHALSGLGLIVSLAILAMLKEVIAMDDLLIKWPNDVLWQHKKLCGTLIELVETNEIIIGIGINVNSILPPAPDPNKPWCSLYEITGVILDRNTLIAHLLYTLQLYVERFMQYGLESFIDEWDTVDYLKGQKVSILNQNKAITGIAEGINNLGQLILVDSERKMHHLTSGDASILTFL